MGRVWGNKVFTGGLAWGLQGEQRLAVWDEGVDRLKKGNGVVQRGGHKINGPSRWLGRVVTVKDQGLSNGAVGRTQHLEGAPVAPTLSLIRPT